MPERTLAICLGAGAGLIRADLRRVRGTHITARSGGVIATVKGSRPRAVPVLARYRQPLLQAAEFAGLPAQHHQAADLIGLATFLHAAGISCCQRLGDITAVLDPGATALRESRQPMTSRPAVRIWRWRPQRRQQRSRYASSCPTSPLPTGP
jgi:hypothetical protein